EAEPAPVGDGALLGADQERAVLVEPAGGKLVDLLGRAGREPHQFAVAAREHVADAAATGERGMLGHVQRLGVPRNQELRAHPANHLLELVDARVARDVNEMSAVGDDLDTLRYQAVDDPHHRLLVAGNGARGKNYAVAGRERDVGMLVLGNARERGARLALA